MRQKENLGMKLFQKKKNNKGFSLVELIVVVAIMAVLLGVLVPTLVRHVESSRLSKDKSALDEIKNAVEVTLASEKYMDTDVTLSLCNKADKVTLTDSNAPTGFWDEVKANLGNKETIDLSSKLNKGNTVITMTVKDGSCKIDVTTTGEKADYSFSIGEIAGEPVTK